MIRSSRRASVLLLWVALGGFVASAFAEPMRIGFIEFFGNRELSDAQLRPHLAFSEGDMISLDDDAWRAAFARSQRQLSEVAGVLRPHVGGPLCCANGELIVYIGIEETGARGLRFGKPPAGKVRLPPDVLAAGAEFMDAFFAAMAAGDFEEDTEAGHSLFHAQGPRRVQLRFVELARTNRTVLRKVLREGADPAERALAAQILGYVDDKQAVVPDLVRAMRDPSSDVRNDAMRALLVFTKKVPTDSTRVPKVPYEPFVSLLGSPIFTDRNKSAAAVESLTASRDPELLRLLRRQSLAPLVEMARWEVPGHAFSSRTILGRIAGCSEEEIADTIEHDRQEELIAAAMRGAMSGNRTSNEGDFSCAH